MTLSSHKHASPARGCRHALLVLVAIAAALLVPGCGEKTAAPKNDANLRAVTKLFLYYVNTHRGGFPKDEATFKAFIAGKDEAWRAQAGASDIDSLFASARDGQPFELIYGNPLDPRAAQGVVGYERTGVDGKRHVGFRDGTVREIDEQEFARLTTGS